MIEHPILVISYNDDIRKALFENLLRNGVAGIMCESFLEAEDVAREAVYNGILVDLQSVIKAKGDEKLIACSLTGFYPTLRVRALGGMLVPMAMPGDAKQDSSISDFLNKSCGAFTPRRLRLYRRREMVFSALIPGDGNDTRLVMMNMSWGGAFLMDAQPEKFEVGQVLRITFPELERTTDVTVRWVRPWGVRKVPGIGVEFDGKDTDFESVLALLIQREKNSDRDRMIAR